MNEYSSEDIQRAAEEVQRGGFGDFMFRDPGFGRTSRRQTSSRRNTSRKRTTTRRKTSRKQTSRKVTSRRHTTRHRNHCGHRSNWRTMVRGNQEISTCWDDGNMWELRIRNR
ncbi:CotG/ExsB N-terminal domain-containing protein [Neobacillus niacini]|uniref:CotG/ExsB N-terminal domain-containing protein n=1 Tax=Neobacillus niacini TaxID=86668 RepID=UPI0028557C07|nr:hypothetical protein [Neobacillus niacini]MDR6999252.1 hypothetical protein [Neobacillus niacini]